MNRDLKFRAWDKTYNNMWGNKQSCEMLMRQAIFNDLGLADNTGCNYGDFVIFMQFTGLTDKNGKDIYEGDILRYPNPKCFGVVEFGLYEGGEMDDYISGNGFYLKREDSKPSNFGKKESSIHLEIIGNIYEHPHLLTPTP